MPYEDDVVAQLFVSRYRSGAPREEVARAMGYSREWVRRIEADAMRKFRASLEASGWAFEDVLLALAASDPEGDGEEYLTADPDNEPACLPPPGYDPDSSWHP